MDINHLVCQDDRIGHLPLPAVTSLHRGVATLSGSSLESTATPFTSLASLPPVASLTPPRYAAPPHHTHVIHPPHSFSASQRLPSIHSSPSAPPSAASAPQEPANAPVQEHLLHVQLREQQPQHAAQPRPSTLPAQQQQQQQQQRVECGLCGKSFSGISSHNRHVSRTHHKARPFSCSDCGLHFGQKGSLDRHTAAVHLKARPFTCDHCGKGFGRKDNMKIHMTTVHLKKKPFKCDICPKSFGGKRPLKIHRQTVHFKQRPLQCDYCDKRFGQRSNLNVHMKVHRRAGTPPRTSSELPTSPIESMDDLGSAMRHPGVPGVQEAVNTAHVLKHQTCAPLPQVETYVAQHSGQPTLCVSSPI